MASKKIKIRPLFDRVVVLPVSEHERGKTTGAGIFIPETVDKERAERGVVVAVGPGKLSDAGERLPMSVEVDDEVLFTKYGPDEVTIDGEEYFVLNESNILAIIG